MSFNAVLLFAESIKIKATEVGLPVSTPTIGNALQNALGLITILVGLLSIVFIVLGGLQIIGSAGDPQRYKHGRETVTYAVVGVIISIVAYAVVNFVAFNL